MLERNELQTLVICSVRYALGRKSYIVEDVCDIVKYNIIRLDKNTAEVILEDIGRKLDDAKKRGGFVGHEADHNRWVELYNKINSGFGVYWWKD
jgi:hypothetical protein